MSQMIRLILIAAAMSVFLVAMVVDHHSRRSGGTEIILDLEPVDPRDILAGYYVIVRTSIHQMDPDAVDGDNDFLPGDDIFVRLEAQADGSSEPVSIHRERPQEGLYIYGKVEQAWNDGVRARYNLERFYADEETAQALEQRQRTDRDSMRLIVSVGSDGRAIIRGIEIDSERQVQDLL